MSLDLCQVLLNASSPDAGTRTQAESFLEGASNNQAQYGQFIGALCNEFITEGKPDNSRQMAGLYLKNMISAQSNAILNIKLEKWENWVSNDIKQYIKNSIITALNSPTSVIRRTAAQNCAAYGVVELRQKRWPELIPAALQYVTAPDTAIGVGTKVSALESLGYLCEELGLGDIEDTAVNQILSSIIDGMKVERPLEMRYAATKALNSSLAFCEKNFDNENERHAIMMQICEATRCSDVKTRAEAFRCINTVGEYYYSKLPQYAPTLFELTSQAIKSDDQSVGTTALEFWCVICEQEKDADEHNLNAEPNEALPLFSFMAHYAAAVVPVLLEAMTKQDDDDDVDWGIAKAASICLRLLAQTVRDPVVSHVMPFITSHINSPDWHLKEAAVMAFGSILDGPSVELIRPIVLQAMAPLLTAFQDSNPQVRSTTAWTLGVICDYHHESLTQEMVGPLLHTVSTALDDSSSIVVTQACYVIERFSIACEDYKNEASNPLSAYMQVLVTKLWTIASKQDWCTNNVRNIAFEAIGSLIASAAIDMRQLVVQLLNQVLSSLDVTLTQQIQQQEQQDIQTSLCSVLVNCIIRLDTDVLVPYADNIMKMLYLVFQSKNASAQIEAFLATSHLVTKIDSPYDPNNPARIPNFLRYMQHGFNDILLLGLRTVDDHEVCSHAIGLLEDLCIALGKHIRPYTDDIMKCLLELLQSNELQRSVKPEVISVFAEIANALLTDFDVYFSDVNNILFQAGGIPFDFETDDAELMEFTLKLKESILYAYDGIVLAFRGEKQDRLLPAVDSMLHLVKQAGNKNDLIIDSDFQIQAMILLEDLIATYGIKLQAHLRDPTLLLAVSLAIQRTDMPGVEGMLATANRITVMIQKLR